MDDLIAQSKLSIEALNNDNEKSVEDYISIQRDLWTAMKENEAKIIHSKKLTEDIENERVACEVENLRIISSVMFFFLDGYVPYCLIGG